MTVSQFNKLSLDQRQGLINLKGKHISIAAGDKFNYLLYSLFDFLVETTYNKKLNRIEDIIAYREDKVLLEKYIDTEKRLLEIKNG